MQQRNKAEIGTKITIVIFVPISALFLAFTVGRKIIVIAYFPQL